MDIRFPERVILANADDVPLEDPNDDVNGVVLPAPDRVYRVTTTSTPLIQVITEFPEPEMDHKMNQLLGFLYYTALATLFGINIHNHFTHNNSEFSAFVCGYSIIIFFAHVVSNGMSTTYCFTGADGRDHSLAECFKVLSFTFFYFIITIYTILIYGRDHLER